MAAALLTAAPTVGNSVTSGTAFTTPAFSVRRVEVVEFIEPNLKDSLRTRLSALHTLKFEILRSTTILSLVS